MKVNNKRIKIFMIFFRIFSNNNFLFFIFFSIVDFIKLLKILIKKKFVFFLNFKFIYVVYSNNFKLIFSKVTQIVT